jgi:anaerobic selenocysteine-containing dehydrogenase
MKTNSSCYMCTFDCPIVVDSVGAEVIHIDHPGCVRAKALGEQRQSDQRLLHPQMRPSADDTWRMATWDEAVSQTARRLMALREKYGPRSVVFAVGYTKEARPYLQRLAYAFGTLTTSPKIVVVTSPVPLPPRSRWGRNTVIIWVRAGSNRPQPDAAWSGRTILKKAGPRTIGMFLTM